MRKQTKLVAVASAAALLAVGASMTSFAATGWAEEDGQWFSYDKDGNGVMVRNTWVKVVNEEQDDDSDPAEYIYYYMQSNGRAYKTKSGTTQFKTIDGKRYAFDEDGKMLYGWIDDNHERVDDESWYDGVYYLGAWDDGAKKTGWQKIYVEENRGDDEGEEKEFWFNFKSNGKKRDNSGDPNDIKQVTINGKKYGFDDRGVMAYEWTIINTASANSAAQTGTNSNGTEIRGASTSNWRYFNNIEDGARVTKGWFKVVAPEEDNDNVFN